MEGAWPPGALDVMWLLMWLLIIFDLAGCLLGQVAHPSGQPTNACLVVSAHASCFRCPLVPMDLAAGWRRT